MKPRFSRLLLFLIVFASSCHKRLPPSSANPTDNRARLLVDENKNVHASITDLMILKGLEPKTSLHDAVLVTQKAWLRPLGSERYHLENQTITDEMMQHFTRLGLVASVTPTLNNYDYVLLLGSTYESFRSRLIFLEKLAALGLRVKAVALLGSQRLLERQNEIEPMMKENSFSIVPLTEIEMMDALFMQSSFKDLDRKQIIYVASPMKTLDNGALARANTLDTVCW